jgi:hypothetical protein
MKVECTGGPEDGLLPSVDREDDRESFPFPVCARNCRSFSSIVSVVIGVMWSMIAVWEWEGEGGQSEGVCTE